MAGAEFCTSMSPLVPMPSGSGIQFQQALGQNYQPAPAIRPDTDIAQWQIGPNSTFRLESLAAIPLVGHTAIIAREFQFFRVNCVDRYGSGGMTRYSERAASRVWV